MSTNPFDDGGGGGGGGMPPPAPKRQHPTQQSRYARQQHHQPPAQQPASSLPPQHGGRRRPPPPPSHHRGGRPPPPPPPPPPPSHPSQPPPSSSSLSPPPTSLATLPPIFSARAVEWPLPPALGAAQYRKWRRESKAAGAALGIAGSGLRISLGGGGGGGAGDGGGGGGGGDEGGGGFGGRAAFAPSSGARAPGSAGGGGYDDGSVAGRSLESGAAGTVSSGATGATGGGGYGGLTGLMGRVLGASSPSASGAGAGAGLLTSPVRCQGVWFVLSIVYFALEDKGVCYVLMHYAFVTGRLSFLFEVICQNEVLAWLGKRTCSCHFILGFVQYKPSTRIDATNGDSFVLYNDFSHYDVHACSFEDDIEEEDLNIPATRPVLPPRAKCVAASNGWIVAVVECGPAPVATPLGAGSNAPGHPMSMQSKYALTSLIPPLRLVSRWNVRRGTSAPGSEGNYLVPLPPPVRPGGAAGEDPVGGAATGNNDPDFGRVVHAFVDPTGCHVLLSAANGEAYYLHSTSKKARKLEGFGPSSDGSYSGFQQGVALAEAVSRGEANVQMGLTPGSYVTAVGWDSDRGTEGSTKRIILGTSIGELYEYTLVSPNAPTSAKSKSSPFDTRVAGEPINVGSTAADDFGDGDPMDAPLLLCRLNVGRGSGSGSGNTRSGADGGAVGGVLFRLVLGGPSSDGGGAFCLVSTGGPHRHTRLHAFRGDTSSNASTVEPGITTAFGGGRGAVALRASFIGGSKSSSVMELPGCVDFAELRGCGDGFALRTETGIYHGSMERTAVGGSSLTVSGSGNDAGMLAYEGLLRFAPSGGGSSRRQAGIPSSIGLTPHHFVTLGPADDDVRFANRVSGKVVQEERVDWASVSPSSQADDSDARWSRGGARGAVAEILTDVRRPDQVWLRRGRSLVHISSSCEDRDVWKFTLEKCVQSTTPHGITAAIASSSSNAPLTSEEKVVDAQFEHAKSLCVNASQRSVVNAVRAEYHLSQGRVELAAHYMAECPPALMPFADTAARLALPSLGASGPNSLPTTSFPCRANPTRANEALADGGNAALIAFLSDKMGSAPPGRSVTRTMLGTLVTENLLEERERRGALDGPSVMSLAAESRPRRAVQSIDRAPLHRFLSSYVRDMDPNPIVGALASHDVGAGECAGYAAASGEIGAAIDAALSGEDQKSGALDALRVLNDSPIEKAEPYCYKYALTLLSRAPMSASKSFVARYTEGLSDNKLLPAFMHYEQRRKKGNSANSKSTMSSATFVDDENASIRFMEGVIKLGSRSRAVYNYLTSLYAGMEDEGPLFRFLSAHVPPVAATPPGGGAAGLLLQHASLKEDSSSSPLDKSYALRTVLRSGRHFRSAVKLYMGFGMRQQAVELALKVDPALARELARQGDGGDETKRLWLMIARNAAAGGGASSSRDGKDVVARVVAVLKDCGPDILSIEDVLPFLPDFAQIDQFKDEICNALASYSSKIDELLKEMNECDLACDALRDELSRLKITGTQVRSDARCAFTNKYVLEEGKPFYAFPSGYVVLESALKREVIPYLNKKQLERMNFVENELARVNRSKASKSRSTYEKARDDYETEELQAELDGLIAAECPLTGSIMVESIDRGFPGTEDELW
ncbi:hypothetical protein ACHAWF_018898 [Thalassiosira exigua]